MKDITFEQAQFISSLDENVIEQNMEKILEILRYFASNTMAQVFSTDAYYQAMSLQRSMMEKDYSKKLFEDIDILDKWFKENQKALEELKTKGVQLAQLKNKLNETK